MRYKGPGDRRSRSLRREFAIEVYDGDWENDPNCPIVIETVVAFNAVDALRKCGGRRASRQPVALWFVTYPNDLEPKSFRIFNTEGPTDIEVNPSIAMTDPSDDWDF